MSTQPSERNLALFIDFDNVALGARDARMRFDCRLLLQRVLEKGKVVVKRAYADWHHYKEHMTSLHEAAIELIEVPMPRISGKNSADIRMVVDAIDLCWSKDHIDTFVLVSGDSDFSPLVSKLRENNKRVIGVGMRNSSSHLLISNCDEWIFYDDIYQTTVVKLSEKVASVPPDKRELFDFLLNTTQSLLQESRGVLFSSLVKDTMKRKQPDFNETNYGYATFGDLLEDMRDHGLLTVERDSRAGGTLVVLGLGKSDAALTTRTKARRSRRGRDRDRNGGGERDADTAAAPAPAVTSAPAPATATSAAKDDIAAAIPAEPGDAAPVAGDEDPSVRTDDRTGARRSRRRSSRRRRGGRGEGVGQAGESPANPPAEAAKPPLAAAPPEESAANQGANPPTAPVSRTEGAEAPRKKAPTRKKTAKKAKDRVETPAPPPPPAEPAPKAAKKAPTRKTPAPAASRGKKKAAGKGGGGGQEAT